MNNVIYIVYDEPIQWNFVWQLDTDISTIDIWYI